MLDRRRLGFAADGVDGVDGDAPAGAPIISLS
jgi:hypothetical protein